MRRRKKRKREKTSKSQPADISEPEQAQAADKDAANKEEDDETLTAADELASLQVTRTCTVLFTHEQGHAFCD